MHDETEKVLIKMLNETKSFRMKMRKHQQNFVQTANATLSLFTRKTLMQRLSKALKLVRRLQNKNGR